MKLTNVGTTLKTAVSKGGLKIKKYSPEILMVVGITGVVGAAVLACKATLKCEDLIDEHDGKMKIVQEVREKFDEEKYSDENYKKDILVVKTQTAVNFVKLYGPSVTLGIASIACILGAHNIMKKRNVALAAAYKLVEQSFSEYRQRVKDELGEEKDFHFRYGTVEDEETETIVGEDGKKKKINKAVQRLSDHDPSMYARMFESEERVGDGSTWNGSKEFSPIHHYNYAFLTQKQNWMNERLNAYGYLFLNEVYEELGFPKTKAGQAVGWVKDPAYGGNGYVSFGPAIDCVAYNDGDPILVDFNVDGVIWDLIEK